MSADPRLLEGLAWGRPRKGHPEGAVGNHVADLLTTIDAWGETGGRRSDLRFIALVHDGFKYAVSAAPPQDSARTTTRCARAASPRTTRARSGCSPRSSSTTGPYHLWRRKRRTGHVPAHRLDAMLARIPDLPLFVRFVELDGSTEGKRPDPIEWLARGAPPPRPAPEPAALDGQAELLGRLGRARARALLLAGRGADANARGRRGWRGEDTCLRVAARRRAAGVAAAPRNGALTAAPRAVATAPSAACCSAARAACPPAPPIRGPGSEAAHEGARAYAGDRSRQAVLAERRELDDEIERRVEPLSQTGEHVFVS